MKSYIGKNYYYDNIILEFRFGKEWYIFNFQVLFLLDKNVVLYISSLFIIVYYKLNSTRYYIY